MTHDWPSRKNYVPETWKANNRTEFFWWWLGPIYGHMGSVHGDVPANESNCKLKQVQSGMHPRTEQVTVWPAGSWDSELCYRRAIITITIHKACSSKGNPQRSLPTKLSYDVTEGVGSQLHILWLGYGP